LPSVTAANERSFCRKRKAGESRLFYFIGSSEFSEGTRIGAEHRTTGSRGKTKVHTARSTRANRTIPDRAVVPVCNLSALKLFFAQ
jgi:hypothetical protein